MLTISPGLAKEARDLSVEGIGRTSSYGRHRKNKYSSGQEPPIIVEDLAI